MFKKELKPPGDYKEIIINDTVGRIGDLIYEVCAMFSLLLAIIYIAFISLGLPDSLLGSAWPVMFEELGVPVSYAGIITMIILAGTIISSLLSDKITKKLGTGLVTAISVLLTAGALLRFIRFISPRLPSCCLLCPKK